MRVVFSNFGPNNWACNSLHRALCFLLPDIRRVAREFEVNPDQRTLFVVIACPCCEDLGTRPQNAIWVTPFRGMDFCGHEVHRIGVNPPWCTPGEDGEARNVEHFLEEWRKTLQEAVKLV